MKQLTQQLKSGSMEILEVPFPALGLKEILVRNYYSVISAGTEGKTVSDARKGYVAKAQSRQKELAMVFEMIKTQGYRETYKVVMNKLEAPSPLGYSCAGEVIAIGREITEFSVGDYVACGGSSANHADVVAVPINLCVKVPKNINLKEAAFTTIAAIAIQGIRQTEISLGESCVIIGLGLIGQITIQVLKAAGIKTIGVDINETQVEAARRCGSDIAVNRNSEGIEKIIEQATNGFGADAVIITAASVSTDPVDFAGRVCRKKGKIVIVGNVPTGFSRESYYKKELDLRMSSSYGPGRYDTLYEEKGIDYPIGYVRFTENRNMQSFVDLLAAGRLNIDKIITHEFTLDDAPAAYDMILQKSEPFSGILIRYNTEKQVERSISLKEHNIRAGIPNVGFVGAGNFAQNMLLPRIRNLCNFISIATVKGNESKYVATKYRFKNCFETGEEVIRDPEVNTVFIVTRHNSHAKYVIEALNAGKNVFVEKPLAMNEQELEQVLMARQQSSGTNLMLGFNRRFSPAVLKIKSILPRELPKAIHMRINAGAVPPDHWVNDPDLGGGRIIGEVCHFIDLGMHLSEGKIISVNAENIRDHYGLNDTLIISLKFDNGSIASISYFSNGNKHVAKEEMEIFCGGLIARIDDFKTLEIFGNKIKTYKSKGQDKGHTAELKAFLESVKNGTPCPIPFEEAYLSMLSTFKVLESLRENRKVFL